MTTFRTLREFSAPPEWVFAAFASPDRLARWWGPDGFSNTFEVFEFTSGGIWRFTMHGPDGTDYPNESVFVSVEPNCEVVVRHVCQPHFILSIGFVRTTTGTTVTWEQVFENSDLAESVRHIVEPANEQNLDRWQAEVAAGSHAA